uniref:Uncharacterized protein n=1 Tax=Anguilla anguilla TaxID=7936 RepID=A0A0E9VLL4_ANGAN
MSRPLQQTKPCHQKNTRLQQGKRPH